jgi:hypothetical protein
LGNVRYPFICQKSSLFKTTKQKQSMMKQCTISVLLLFCLLVLLSDTATFVHAHGWLMSVGGVKANYANWPGGTFMPPFDEFFDHPCSLPSSSNGLPVFKPGSNVTVQYYIYDPDDFGTVEMGILYNGGSSVLASGIPVPNVTRTIFTKNVTLPSSICMGCVFRWKWTLPTSGDPPEIYYGCVPMNIDNNAFGTRPAMFLNLFLILSVILFVISA